jgi:anaerobic magnesium-protoporphyrin IX monomethyl ester cyclase
MHKSEIALARPNYSSHLITPPLGLGYLSSYLKHKGHSTKIIDGLNFGYSIGQIVDRCAGAGVVGINCMTAYFPEVVKLSRALKNKGFTVVIGGPHASALPDITLEETGADYVIIGEGELTLSQLLDNLDSNKPIENIPGLLDKKDKIIARRPLLQDLDSLPFPDWEQMDPRVYKKAPHGGLVKSFPIAPVITSRGCPFKCTFCASPSFWGDTIRFRTPENVVDEIQYLISSFGIREVHFEDDNLTLKRSHVEDICNLILKRGIKISWAAPNGVRVDTLDSDLLALMKKSGCYFLAFGIESGNQGILDSVKKGVNLESIRKAVSLAKKAGIITQGFFIFGLPGETEGTIKESIRFSKEIALDKAQFLILDLLPGSELWDKLKKEKIADWGGYKSYQEAVWLPEGMSARQLNRMAGFAFRSFFLRPKQILFILRYLKPSQIPFIIRRMVDFRVFNT